MDQDVRGASTSNSSTGQNAVLRDMDEKVERSRSSKRTIPTAVDERRLLRCAAPNCWVRLHDNPDFGGYC